MKPRAVFTVLRREYVARVKTKSFALMTVLLPLIMGGSMLLPLLLQRHSTPRQLTLAVADGTGVVADSLAHAIGEPLPDGRPKYVIISISPESAHVSEAWKLLELRAYDGFLQIPAGAIHGEGVAYFLHRASNFQETRQLQRAVNSALVAARLSAEGLDPGRIIALTRPAPFTVTTVRAGSAPQSAETFVAGAMVLAMLMYVTLSIYGVWTMQSVLTDKTSRIAEILVSSITPIELMYGKVLGTGLAGLTQIAIWLGALVGVSFASPGSAVAQAVQAIGGVSLPAFVAFYISGFFLYAALYAGVGAVCTTNEEAGQLQLPVSLLLMVAFVVMASGLNNPDNTTVVVLSYVPFFAPIIMMLRLAAGEANYADVALALVGIAVTTAFVLWGVGKLFRTGLLITGKRPSLRELYRWVREA
jgi:ABC-2 type transport system permease protein